MQLLNICTKREYEKEGEKKIKWYKAGILKITDRGKSYIRLFNQPMTDYYVFSSDPPEEMEISPQSEN